MEHRPSGLVMRNLSTYNSLGLITTDNIIHITGTDNLLWILRIWLHWLHWYAELSTSQHLLGTPETSRRGRSTRKARRALTSNPPGLPPCPCIEGWGTSPSPSPFSSLVNSSRTTLKSLSENKGRNAHY